VFLIKHLIFHKLTRDEFLRLLKSQSGLFCLSPSHLWGVLCCIGQGRGVWIVELLVSG